VCSQPLDQTALPGVGTYTYCIVDRFAFMSKDAEVLLLMLLHTTKLKDI
jgi:hypothetical protein